ncbi:hypothetical protein NE865_01892 [Phthorimaea operculella]|nr:hypothetical protein NE865_01892 [Phthorimaea operculella]
MRDLKVPAAVIFWIILAIDGQRWYSATFHDSDPQRKTHPPRQTIMTNYVYDHDNDLKYLPVSMVYNKNQTKRDKFSATRRQDLTTFIPPPKPKSKRPKRKIVRKCPAVYSNRQKKQLDSNQTIQKRFLEVFEVVEFDHVACVSSSGLEGTCLPEFDCQSSGGAPMGTCADGYGTCCVIQFTCDDTSAAPAGWFVNPGFPAPSSERLSCVFTLHKASPEIQQIRLDFNNFELLAPTAGTCEQDQFMITGQNVNNVLPILCGVNTGQHVYIEVGEVDGPITFSIQTVSSDSRLFAIKITQLTASDELAAPAGCLQYFRGPQGYLESFNYRDKSDIAIARTPSYLNNLNYAMCIERAPETCSVTYTNTGNMQIVNYDSDGLPVIPPMQAGVEIFNCPTDWLLVAAVRLCGERLNDGSVLQDFALDAPVTDIGAGPLVVWFRSDGGYVGRGFKLQYQQNSC